MRLWHSLRTHVVRSAVRPLRPHLGRPGANTTVARAVRAAAEPLERRLLLSFTPTLAGPVAPVQSGPYPVTVRAAGAPGPVTWTVRWYDAANALLGTAQPFVQSNPASDLPHDLSLPAGTHRLAATATATDTKNTPDPADDVVIAATTSLALDPSFAGPAAAGGGPGRLARPGAGVYAMAAAAGPADQVPPGSVYLAGGGNLTVTRVLADGSYDPTWAAGSGGNAWWPTYVRAVAVQPDGRVLAAGSYNGDLLVVRYRADGTGDPTFGGGDGIAHVDLGGGDEPAALAVDADGRVVVAGSSVDAGGFDADLFVARLTAAGDLDPSFGTHVSGTSGPRQGFLRQEFWGWDAVHDVVVLPASAGAGAAGDIVTAGQAGGNLTLARYDPDGTPDAAFDGDGLLQIWWGQAGRVSAEVSGAGAGVRVTVAGMVQHRLVVARYTADGAADATFGPENNPTPGRIDLGLVCPDGVPAHLAVRDGAVTVAALAVDPARPADPARVVVVRLTPGGLPDPAFGEAGTARAWLPMETNWFHRGGLVLDRATGDVLVAGQLRPAAGPDPNGLEAGVVRVRADNVARVVGPAAPTNFAATAQANSTVGLNWTAPTGGAASYEVRRATDAAFTSGLSEINPPPGETTHTDAAGLTVGLTYYYQVRAVVDGVPTAWSSAASATVLPPPPDAPTGLRSTSRGYTTVGLAWNPQGGATSFLIRHAPPGGGFVDSGTVTSDQTSFTVAGLVPNATYRFMVIAANDGGASNPSAERTESTLPTPTNLAVGEDPLGTLRFTWTDSAPSSWGFVVERQVGGTGPFTSFASARENQTTAYAGYTDAPGTYAFRVYAHLIPGGVTAPSDPVTVVVPPAPSAAAAAVVPLTGVRVQWPAVPGAGGYRVWRETYGRFGGDGDWTELPAVPGPGTGTVQTIDPGPTATARRYRVAAVHPEGLRSAFTVSPPVGRVLAPGDDEDRDGLTNQQEHDRGTSPTRFDSDGDLLGDGWEARYPRPGTGTGPGFDPRSWDDPQGDADGDGLSNLGETTHGTDPTAADTDGDGTGDAEEAGSGGDPTSPADGGLPPPDDERVLLNLETGDPSTSESERWAMRVGRVAHVAPEFGRTARADYWFKAGESYPITLEHQGTSQKQLDEQGAPDYDWRAKIQQGGTVWTFPRYFIIDPNNPSLMQAGHYDGGEQNAAAGKTAYLHLPRLDADVDSDNRDGYAVPGDNAAEDRLERTPAGSKDVPVLGGDLDGDQVPDVQDYDGIAGAEFVPLVVRLSDNLRHAQSSSLTVTFGYAAGSLRLWKPGRNASAARSVTADTVPANTPIRAADIGLAPGGHAVLYVEATDPGGAAVPITVTAIVDNGFAQTTWEDVVHVRPIGADLDVDSDNDDGLSTPGRTPAEEEIEAATDKPGKIVAANAGDADADGLTDYADFDGVDGLAFVPVEVKLPAGLDLSKARVKLTYAGSDPSGVERSGEGTVSDPYTYNLAPGLMRLWKLDGYEPRVADAGVDNRHYVAPDQAYTAEELNLSGGSGTLYLEAVRHSAELADGQITLAVDPDGDAGPAGYTLTDTVRATFVNTRLLLVDDQGAVTETEGAETSLPTPAFTGTTISVTNPQFSPDKTRILGTVTITGTLDDALSDMIPGAEGTITSAGLFVNGATEATHTIPLDVAPKPTAAAASLLKPFDFSATVSAVLENVELQPGWNTFKLVAANAAGGSGDAQASVEVVVTPPPDDVIDVQLEFGGDPYYDPNVTLRARTLINGFEQSAVDLTWSGVAGERRYDNPGAGASVVLMADRGELNPGQTDEVRATVKLPPARLLDPELLRLGEVGANDRKFKNTRRIGVEDRVDYRDFLPPAIGGNPGTTASPAGKLRAHVYRVDGPAALNDHIDQLLFGQNGVPRAFTRWQDRLYVGGPEGALRDRPTTLVLIRPRGLADAVEGAINAPDHEGTFMDGLLRGLGKPFVELKETAVGLADTLGKGARFTNNLTGEWVTALAVQLKFGGTIQAPTPNTDKVVATVRQAYQIVNRSVGVAFDLLDAFVRDPAGTVEQVLAGTHPLLDRLPDELRQALEIGAELINELVREVKATNESPYKQGYYLGYALTTVVIEVGLAMATGGAGTVAKLAGKAATLEKLAAKFVKADGPLKAAMKRQGVTDDGAVIPDVNLPIHGAKVTTMCFVAGTPVHTANGLVPIEAIRPGDLVWSRDEATGAWAYKPVTDTFVTRPDAVYRVTYDPDGAGPRPGETLGTTAPHPFYVANRDGDGDGRMGGFVPAGRLVVGDELVLADGSAAWVTALSVEEAAAGQAFTTYNFAVGEYHTYFVGAAGGVWVHNEARGGCEIMYSLYRHIRERRASQQLPGGNSPWHAFLDLLAKTEYKNPDGTTASKQYKFDAFLRPTTEQVMRDAYATALETGNIDLVPTVKEAATKLGIGDGYSRMSKIEYQNHHTVPKYVQDLLHQLDGVDRDSVPALLVHQVDHTGANPGPGRGSFHSILYDGLIPKNTPRGSLTSQQIAQRLRQAYDEFGRPDVGAIVEKWLNGHGVSSH